MEFLSTMLLGTINTQIEKRLAYDPEDEIEITNKSRLEKR